MAGRKVRKWGALMLKLRPVYQKSNIDVSKQAIAMFLALMSLVISQVVFAQNGTSGSEPGYAGVGSSSGNGSPSPMACNEMARICADGSVAKVNSQCEHICAEDKKSDSASSERESANGEGESQR